MQVSWSNVNGG